MIIISIFFPDDITNIKDIATQDFFKSSACIRKYFDSNNKIYYDTNNPNFKWPSLSHGHSIQKIIITV